MITTAMNKPMRDFMHNNMPRLVSWNYFSPVKILVEHHVWDVVRDRVNYSVSDFSYELTKEMNDE